ncbi:MAG: hypothetical protein RL253_553, partial [Bacteroidota bacterium]
MMKFLFIFLPMFAMAQWVSVAPAEYIKALDEVQKVTNFESSYAYKCHYTFIDQLTGDTLEKAEGYLTYNSKTQLLNFQQFSYQGIQTKDLVLLYDTLNQKIMIQEPTNFRIDQQQFYNMSKEVLSQLQVRKWQAKDFIKFELTLPKGSEYSQVRMTINHKNQIINYQLVSAAPIQLDSYEESTPVLPIMDVTFDRYE